MTVTTKGFQGTISDVDMSTQFPHHAPAVYARGDLAVTAVGGARTVSVAAGSALAGFVKYTSDAAQTVALAPPASGGKWYAITLNRQWSPTNTCTLQADDLAVTDGTGTVPALPPATVMSAAAGLPNQLGTAGSTAGQRQILAFVYVRAADTTLGIFDVRLVSSAAGNVGAVTLVAMILASVRHLQEGAIVDVLQHTTASGGNHLSSVWRKGPTTLFPLAPIITNDSGLTYASGRSTRADILDVHSLGYNGAFTFSANEVVVLNRSGPSGQQGPNQAGRWLFDGNYWQQQYDTQVFRQSTASVGTGDINIGPAYPFMIVAVHLIAANYDKKFVLIITQSPYNSGGSVSSIYSETINDAVGYGNPTFSVHDYGLYARIPSAPSSNSPVSASVQATVLGMNSN